MRSLLNGWLAKGGVILLGALLSQWARGQTLLSKPEFVNGGDLVKPNVMLTLDNSGSMVSVIAFDTALNYPVRKDASGNPLPVSASSANECQSYAADAAVFARCRSWFSFYRTRMEYAKTVTWNTVFALEDKVRVGLFELYQTNPRLPLAPWTNAHKSGFYTQLMALSPSGNTPLHETLNRVGNYFASSSAIYASDTGGAANSLSCRANYHVLVTDGIWNGGNLNRGNQDGSDGPLFTSSQGVNYQYRANGLSPVTCNAASVLGCTQGISRSDAIANTLADEAMYWWKNDLRPTFPKHVRRKASDPNPAFWQNITLYGVALDINGNLNSVPAWPSPGWPDPYASNSSRVDDLRHAAHNTFGKFFTTASPAQYEQALKDILADIPTEVGTQSASAVAGRVILGSGLVYEPSYRAGSASAWDGNIQAKTLNANGSIVANPVVWDAKAMLNAALNPVAVPVPSPTEAFHNSRKIVSWNTATNTAVPFRAASLASDQLVALKGGASSSQNSGDILNYLRGERYNEQRFGSTNQARPYRNREAYLGAIVNSVPLVVREAARTGYDRLPLIGSSYKAAIQTLNARSPSVWVGASDGMIHAFNAATGAEWMAYVPAAAYGVESQDYRLFQLSQPSYEHQYIADGQFSESTWHHGSGWRTMLLAGMGAGGRGRVAFDTTVSNFASQTEAALAAKVLWELHPGNAGAAAQHLGYSFGQAWTLPVAVSAAAGTAATTTWVTLAGNGYASASGAAALLVINPVTGALLHTLLMEAPSTWAPNGLSTPRPVFDAQGRVKALYAGDLRGNLWKIKLEGSSPAAWTVSKLYAGSASLPIMVQPEVDYAPNGVDYQLLVGTGKLIHVGDKAATTQQYFLGVVDRQQTSPTVLGDLAQITATRQGGAVNLSTQAAVNAYGFKLRLPQAGDRVLAAAAVYRGVVYFTSFNPASVNSSPEPCAETAAASESIVYAIDPRTGTYPERQNGYPSPAQIGQVVNAGLGGFSLLRAAPVFSNADGSAVINPNSTGGACFVLVNQLNGQSQTVPVKCPSAQPVRYWRLIPGGASQ